MLDISWNLACKY